MAVLTQFGVIEATLRALSDGNCAASGVPRRAVAVY